MSIQEELSENQEEVLGLWHELKVLVESLNKDVTKNAERSNVAAGVRVRKGARKLRTLCTRLVKHSLESDKEVALRRQNSTPQQSSTESTGQ